MLKFILTLIAVSILSGLVLIISDKQVPGKMLLATASTLGLFYALGTTVFWFLNFIVAGVIMYFYINSKDIEETLLKIIVLTTTIGILGWWRQTQKEGFLVSPLRYVSSAFTAKQCQDACQGTLGCKYAQVPLATSKSGMKNKCWNSYGFNQRKWGSQAQGGETWLNKLWNPPITLPKSGSSYSGTIQTPSSPYYKVIREEYVGGNGMVPEQVYLHADMRDQGWGNQTWGVYVEGYDKNGKLVFSRNFKAPRTSRTIRYPSYAWRYYNSPQQCIPNRGVERHKGTWRNSDYLLWVKRCRALSSRQCGSFGWGLWCRKYVRRGVRRVFNGYRTKRSQGGLSHQSKTWTLSGNEQKTVARVKCFVKTRGSGHSLRAHAIRWSVKGWKK
tara:strand:+ start:167 stop:1324 length:1158 start_codon:yes stop_codon:yes gene_type:complete